MLFEGVTFHIPSSVPDARREDLILILTTNGAVEASIQEANHIITNSAEFEGWQSIGEGVAVVSVSQKSHAALSCI